MMNRFGPIAQAVEDLLPAHMMSLAIDRLYAEGYELRLDTRGYLNNAMIAVLRRDEINAHTIATLAENHAMKIMKHVSLDDSKTALLAAAFLLEKLVAEQLYLDATNQSVLTALMIVADATEDDNPEWAALVPTAQLKASKMLGQCLTEGLYCHAKVPN